MFSWVSIPLGFFFFTRSGTRLLVRVQWGSFYKRLGKNLQSRWWTGWWFGTFFIFLYIGSNNPNWLSYFSEGWPNHQPVKCLVMLGARQLGFLGMLSEAVRWKPRLGGRRCCFTRTTQKRCTPDSWCGTPSRPLETLGIRRSHCWNGRRCTIFPDLHVQRIFHCHLCLPQGIIYWSVSDPFSLNKNSEIRDPLIRWFGFMGLL